MNEQENKPRLAQPADEEIKNHGDQLARQVRDAAAKDGEEKSGQNGQRPEKE